MKLKFKDNPYSSNQLAYFDKSLRDYVSFNHTPCEGMPPFEADGKCSETALKINGVWLILNGDWRQEYCEEFETGGVEACIKLYRKNLDHRSTWSTDKEGLDGLTEWVERRLKLNR